MLSGKSVYYHNQVNFLSQKLLGPILLVWWELIDSRRQGSMPQNVLIKGDVIELDG